MKSTYIVMDMNDQIQAEFATRQEAVKYAKANMDLQPQVVASLRILAVYRG